MSTPTIVGHTDVTLSRPITISGAPVGVIRMREPTVNDQLVGDAGGGSDAEKELRVFANLCTLTPDDLKQLPIRDYKKLQKTFMAFLD